MGKIKFYMAFGSLVFVYVLFSGAVGARQKKALDQAALHSSNEEQRGVPSQTSALTKQTVYKFLEEQRRNILSKDAKVREQAVSIILQEQRKNISLLIGHIIQDDRMYRENPDSVIAAMRLLGKLRAKEAVGILTEHLDFQAPGANTPTRPYHVLNGREAVLALIEIGKPSIPAVIREVLRGDNYIKLACAAGVIERVEGKEVGAFYLQKLIEKETDPKKQATLRKLKEFVEGGIANL